MVQDTEMPPSYRMVGGIPNFHCLRAEDGPNVEEVAPQNLDFESLSYSPVRYEPSTTIDVERSQARYSNIVVHSSRARLQRRSKVWEEWLKAATAGRNITLLSGFDVEQTPRPDSQLPGQNCQRIPARFFMDRALTRISVLPVHQSSGDGAPQDFSPLEESILVDSIQVICTATDFMLFADQVESELDESERRRAILLQYMKDKGERRRVCFLEATPQDKDRFVQALTALWLEKRNDSSKWF